MGKRMRVLLLCAAAVVLLCGWSYYHGMGDVREKKGSEISQPGIFNGDSNVGKDARAERKELVFANFRDIRDLNPHLYGGEMWAQAVIYEPLIRVTDDGAEPCLAESWEISEDGRVYTFYIRKDVLFSDGTSCDAHAVKANFDAILDNRTRHVWMDKMRLVDSVEVLDDHTFRLTLKGPYYPAIIELGSIRPFTMASLKTMKDGKTKNGVTEFIGTGPYKLTDFVTDEYAVFEVNEHYWGEIP